MSDLKPIENFSDEDMQALLDLLERLGKRDEVRRYQERMRANSQTPVVEEKEAETVRPVPASFELVDLPAEDSRDLLLLETEDGDEEEDFVRPAIASFQLDDLPSADSRDLLLTDWEDPLKMSEYLIDEPGSEYLIGAEADVLYDNEEGDLPPPPKNRRNPFKALWLGFCGNLPRKGDSTGTTIRKCGFLFSLLVMLLAIAYLVMDLVVVPVQNDQLKKELIALYHPEKSEVVVSKQEVMKNHYPLNMLASFTGLYDRNDDVRGWISYHASGKKDFLDIDYPIVYQNVKDTENPYLNHDYDGDKNKNGTLYFAQNNRLNSYRDTNRALIVYGHNMASGQMFAGLNKMNGNLNNARAAATFTMSTLFRVDQYKVFAVVLIDEADRNDRSYNMWRTQFASDTDFLRHIDGIQARSMFRYPVEVTADDQILVLSTCTGKSSAHVKDGRLLVVARRVRDGEEATVDTSKITKKSYAPNADDSVIMPYSWYINQNKPVHKYYIEHGLTSGPMVSTQSTQSKPTTSTRPGQTTATGTTGTATGTTGTGSTDATGTTDTTTPSGSTTQTGSSTNASSSATQSTVTTKPTEPTKPGCKHQYDHACDATCNVEGCGYERSVEHVYANACDNTCNTEGCEHKRDVPDHVYDNACDKECNACGNTREVEDHHYGESVTTDPTCGKDGSIKKSCTECGYTYTVEVLPATGEHTYGEDGKCAVCGAEKSDE